MCVPYEERVGQKINNLTIIELTSKRYSGHRVKIMCKVRCDCGKEFETLIESVISNQTKSCGCIRKKYNNSAERKIYTNYRNSARNRKYEFKLNFDDVKQMIKEKCFYCGSMPNRKKEVYKDEMIFNGIDRVDNEKGYTVDNTVTCCYVCNRAKHTLTHVEFEQWISRLINYKGDKNEHV